MLPAALAPSNALSSISPVAGQPDRWSFGPSDITTGEFDAAPQTGNSVTLNGGDTWRFMLNNVTLPAAIVQPAAEISTTLLFAHGATQTIPLTINIETATDSLLFFKGDRSNIAPGETATLSWACEEMNYCIIDPPDCKNNSSSNNLPTTGSCQVSPAETTVYTLYAYGDGVILSAQRAVSVDSPRIVKFGGLEGISSVNCLDTITLVWVCNEFTADIKLTASSDVFIPPLLTGSNTAQHGSVTIGPMTEPTMFTFTAFGTNKQNFDSRNPLIGINDVNCAFTADPATGTWQKDKVTLTWNITSAAEVSLSPQITPGPSLQNLSGSAAIYPEENTTYTLSVRGFKGNQAITVNLPVVLQVTPVVINFSVSPPLIMPLNDNWSASLIWDVQAQTASIDQGIGTVNLKDSYLIETAVNQKVYTLTAGTIQNPGLVINTAQVVKFLGPFTFNVFEEVSIPFYFGDGDTAFGFKLMESALFAGLQVDDIGRFYGADITGVISDNPQYTGCIWINGSDVYYIILRLNGTPQFNIRWADPASQHGTIMLIETFG